MPSSFDPQFIVKAWLHAHEEDRGVERVYRPEDYPFPPSRGRTGYEFRADGTLLARRPGPVDRTVTQTGRWTLAEDGTLELHLDSGTVERLRVVELGADRLVVR